MKIVVVLFLAAASLPRVDGSGLKPAPPLASFDEGIRSSTGSAGGDPPPLSSALLHPPSSLSSGLDPDESPPQDELQDAAMEEENESIVEEISKTKLRGFEVSEVGLASDPNDATAKEEEWNDHVLQWDADEEEGGHDYYALYDEDTDLYDQDTDLYDEGTDPYFYDDEAAGYLDQWRVDLETTQVRYWHRMHRALEENGTLHLPDQAELAELIVEEVGKEQDENGTADARMAMIKVAEKILAQASVKGKNISLTDEQMEELTKKFDFPDDSPELEEVDMSVMSATNQSECLLPHHCEDKQYAVKVKDFIKQMLNDYAKKGKEPDVDEIYERLEKELGVEPKHADALIQSSSKIRKYLKKKMRTTERMVRRKELVTLTDQVEATLLDAGNNMTDLDETMKELNMDEQELAELLQAMGTKRSKKVVEAVTKPQKEMEERVKRGYAELAKESGNHTHFEEIEEIDEETGQRKLQFVRHPSRMSMEDHIKAVDDHLHRRRLARNTRPKDTTDFQRRLSDHIEELQGHIRHLQLACPKGTTATRCVADGLGDVTSDLSTIQGKVFNELNPLNTLLDKLDKGQDSMDKVERLAKIIGIAVGIATNIPGAVGTIFKLVDKGMKVPLKILKAVDDKGTQFENSVGKLWQNSVGRIDDLIGSFDSGAVYYTITGATAVATIQESTCATSLVNELSGANLIGGVERAVGFVSKYVNVLLTALKALMNALESTAWRVISSTLNGIVRAVEPVRKFFAPFSSLSDLIQKKVEIRPWFKLPYTISRLGWNRCDSGYHKGIIDKRTCFENNSPDWTYHILQNRMRKTCRGGGLRSHWSGECNNNGYGRHKVKWYLKCHWVKKWWGGYPSCSWKCERGGYSWCPWDPLKCIASCKSGYSAFLNTCYKSNCPRGYGNVIGKALCTRQIKRHRNSRGTNCNQYRIKAGTRYKQDILGNCWQSCGHGHSEFLGACFPPAVLKISIQDIFDALAKIMKFITGLPIVKEILGFIDKIVETILKPVLTKVEAWLKDAFGLPEFPSIGMDLLPFDAFNKIDINMPELPDLSAITDMPSKLLDKVYKQLPAPLPSLGNCGRDFDCILTTLGMGDMVNFFGSIADIFDQISFSDFFEQLKAIVTGVKCKAWKTKTAPVSDLLAEVGLPDVNACDIELKYCAELDISGIESALAALDEMFQNILDLFQKGEGGRRLAITEDKDAFWPLLGVRLPFGGAVSPIGYVADLTTKDKQGTKKGHPMGFHVNFAFQGALNLGVIRRYHRFKFGLEVGVGATLKFGHVSGPQAMLKKCIDFVEEMQEFEVSSLGQTSICDGPIQGETYKYKAACEEVETIRQIRNFIHRRSLALTLHRGSVNSASGGNGKADKTPNGCYKEDLHDLYEEHGRNKRTDFSKSAAICVKHWYSEFNDFETAKAKAEALFTGLDNNQKELFRFPKTKNVIWTLLKESQLHTQFFVMRTALANSVVYGTPPFLGKNNFLKVGKDEGNPSIEMLQVNVGVDIANGFGAFFQFGNFANIGDKTQPWTLGQGPGGGLLSFHAGSFTLEAILKLFPAVYEQVKKLVGSNVPEPTGATKAKERRENAQRDAVQGELKAKHAKQNLDAKVTDAEAKKVTLQRAKERKELYEREGKLKELLAEKKVLIAERERKEKVAEFLKQKQAEKEKFLARQSKIKDQAGKLGEDSLEGSVFVRSHQRRQAKFEIEEAKKELTQLTEEINYEKKQAKAIREMVEEREKFDTNSAEYEKAKENAETDVAKAHKAKTTAEIEKNAAEKEFTQKKEEVEKRKRTERIAAGEEGKTGFLDRWKNAEKSITFEFVMAFVLDPQCVWEGCTPTNAPTGAPTISGSPTDSPSNGPTNAPSDAPTKAPTKAPTTAPTQNATEAPQP